MRAPPDGGVTIHVKGLPPVAQPRARANPNAKGVYVPKTGAIRNWKLHVVATAMAYPWWPTAPFGGPLRVACFFFLPRAKYMMGPGWPDFPVPHVKKPDRDNLDKAVLDCLTMSRDGFKDRGHAGLWKDDSLVCQGPVEKWYVAKGCEAGAFIHISTAKTWAERHGEWRPWEQ